MDRYDRLIAVIYNMIGVVILDLWGHGFLVGWGKMLVGMMEYVTMYS